MPPTRIVRYCCSELKEGGNPNRLIATGVRWAESKKEVTEANLKYWGRQQVKASVFLMRKCLPLTMITLEGYSKIVR